MGWGGGVGGGKDFEMVQKGDQPSVLIIPFPPLSFPVYVGSNRDLTVVVRTVFLGHEPF